LFDDRLMKPVFIYNYHRGDLRKQDKVYESQMKASKMWTDEYNRTPDIYLKKPRFQMGDVNNKLALSQQLPDSKMEAISHGSDYE